MKGCCLMKALGIVRKIDDLGRVVVPKEVRDTQGWKSGQALEMFMSNEGLVMKPYHDGEEMEQLISVLKRAQKYLKGGPAKELEADLKEAIQYLEKK
jgi:transcriptional pleiotropic regulator of transition state genes